MEMSGVLISLFVGAIFVVIWGIISYIVTRQGEFKGVFLGGMANFLFFFGGVLAPYIAGLIHAPAGPAPAPVAGTQGAAFSVVVVIEVACATTLAVLVMNACAGGFTNALERMKSLGSVSFTAQGYRDTQMYFGGAIGVLCLSAAMIYGFYVGSVRPYATYLSVVSGVLVSLGVQSLLYWLFGMFANYQFLRIVRVTTPEVLGTYGAVARKLFGIGITAMLGIFLVMLWSMMMWLSVMLGSIVSRLSGFSIL